MKTQLSPGNGTQSTGSSNQGSSFWASFKKVQNLIKYLKFHFNLAKKLETKKKKKKKRVHTLDNDSVILDWNDYTVSKFSQL